MTTAAIAMTPQESEEMRDYFVKHSFDRDFVNCLNRVNRKYGDGVFEVLGVSNRNLDIARFSEEFFGNSASNVADVSVDDNANVSEKNISHYPAESSKATLKLDSLETLYVWVKKFYTKKDADVALEKVLNGEIFVNDLSSYRSAYCFAFDLRNLMWDGMSFYKGNMKIGAPKRASSFISLVIQSVAYISNQIVGAAGLADFIQALDYYLRKDYGEDYASRYKSDSGLQFEIQELMQNFIYSMNFPFRGAGQSAFTNVSIMDRGFIKNLFTKEGVSGQDYTYPDGTIINVESTYNLGKFFFEYFSKINGKEGLFTFPVITLAISLGDNGEYLDPEFVNWVSEVNCEKGLGNIYLGETTSLSNCCRLRSDVKNAGALGFQNSFGVSGISIGSHRCVGLNLPRLSLLEKENPDIFEENIEVIHKILYTHRQLIRHLASIKQLPLYDAGWISLSRQYSTIGFLGMNEYLKNKGLNPLSVESLELGVSLLKKVESKIQEWREVESKEQTIYNLEQIPAESFAVRLAKIDSLLGYNPNNFVMYSNQYVPLWEESSIYDRCRLQGQYDQLTSGGSILHINVQDQKSLSPIQFKAILEQARKTGAKYLGINYVFSKCEQGHTNIGKADICPVCTSKITEHYTRVVGYLSRVGAWNKTRRTWDYPNRYFYKNGKLEEVVGPSEVNSEKSVENS